MHDIIFVFWYEDVIIAISPISGYNKQNIKWPPEDTSFISTYWQYLTHSLRPLLKDILPILEDLSKVMQYASKLYIIWYIF